eukprot:1956475-Rhodomonas_salina.2
MAFDGAIGTLAWMNWSVDSDMVLRCWSRMKPDVEANRERQTELNEGCHGAQEGQTPLLMAAFRNHESIVVRLIAAKCNIDQTKKVRGGSLAGTSCFFCFLFCAHECISLCTVDFMVLVSRGLGGVSIWWSMCGRIVASDAASCCFCKVDAVIMLRSEGKWNDEGERRRDGPAEMMRVAGEGQTGATPVYAASQYGHVEVIDHLIAAKCNVNLPEEVSGAMHTGWC